LTVDPDASIAEAARAMTEGRYKIVCVVDADRRLLGILDRADLLRAAQGVLSDLATADAGRSEADDGDEG
jgi:CBS-domain-containing membrane protein